MNDQPPPLRLPVWRWMLVLHPPEFWLAWVPSFVIGMAVAYARGFLVGLGVSVALAVVLSLVMAVRRHRKARARDPVRLPPS